MGPNLITRSEFKVTVPLPNQRPQLTVNIHVECKTRHIPSITGRHILIISMTKQILLYTINYTKYLHERRPTEKPNTKESKQTNQFKWSPSRAK